MGVDKGLPMLHVCQGLFVQRQTDGSVRVMCTNGEEPLDTGANLRHDARVPLQSWCSAVAHTSARGDTLEGVEAAEEMLKAATGSHKRFRK